MRPTPKLSSKLRIALLGWIKGARALPHLIWAPRRALNNIYSLECPSLNWKENFALHPTTHGTCCRQPICPSPPTHPILFFPCLFLILFLLFKSPSPPFCFILLLPLLLVPRCWSICQRINTYWTHNSSTRDRNGFSNPLI